MPTQSFEGDVYEDGQQFKDDAKLMVRFSMKAIQDNFRSEQEGHPIFVDIPYIEVITPGSRDTLVTEATPQYQQRFRRQWEAFKARQEPALNGTPVNEVPWLTASQVAMLLAINVKTVEQLANLPDNLAQGIMGNFDIRRRAKLYLEAAAGEAVVGKLEAQIRDRDEKIGNMEKMMIDMKAQLDKLSAPKAATAKA